MFEVSCGQINFFDDLLNHYYHQSLLFRRVNLHSFWDKNFLWYWNKTLGCQFIYMSSLLQKTNTSNLSKIEFFHCSNKLAEKTKKAHVFHMRAGTRRNCIFLSSKFEKMWLICFLQKALQIYSWRIWINYSWEKFIKLGNNFYSLTCLVSIHPCKLLDYFHNILFWMMTSGYTARLWMNLGLELILQRICKL